MNKIYLAFLFAIILFGCTAQETVDAGVKSTGVKDSALLPSDSISIPLSEITETVKYYQYDAGGVAVRYFAVLGSDGVVRTAFDACEVCYRSGKGYTQVGSDVRCNNCGLSFEIDELGTKNKGNGCWPAYLPHQTNNDKVLIKKSDLEAGSYMFG
ncbi:DUF2318 domain-containing protein [Candidatus Micrarchaeota archaeon]|nr:DUF2318 domain-containing protein [Candidatus Micrarchaeota archaeon]